MPATVAVLRSRTSDRSSGGQQSSLALAQALDPDARELGGPPEDPAERHWEADLETSHEALELAAEFMRANADDRPVLTAPHCTIAIATLPTLPEDVRILWLDAHGDFHTPESTESGFLGGMPLAAACGLWSAGDHYGTIDPDRVLLAGARDMEESERENLAEAGIAMIASTSDLPIRVLRDLQGERVFVHLDCDVVDPTEMPAHFPAPGGITLATLRALFEGLARECTVVGCEVTAIEDPDRAADIAECVRALMA